MPTTATCDECNGTINEGDGYIFYSTAGSGSPGAVQETGNMLLCEECANRICSPEGFAKEMPAVQEVSGADFLADPGKMLRMMRDVNMVSIVQKCKAHGFTPEQAKAKAHEFACLWWKDRGKAQAESAAFWKSGKQASAGGCFIATACYGSADCLEVRELQHFRDHVLLPNWPGRQMVRLYYRLSAPIAPFLRQRPGIRAFVRVCLVTPAFKLLRRR